MKHNLNIMSAQKSPLGQLSIGIIAALSTTAISWQLNQAPAGAQSAQIPHQTIAQSPAPATKAQDAVIKWNGIALELIRTEKTPPGMAARNLAMLHTAMFDAVNAIAKTHKTYQVNIEAPTGASEEAAATAAAHRILSALYPTQVAKLDAAKANALTALTASQPPNSNSVSINLSINPADLFSGKSPIADPKLAISRPQTDGIKLGETVADRILAIRQDDGVDAKTTYTPINQVGNWQPVPPDFKPASTPQWKNVKPFSMTSGNQFQIAKMPSLISPEYLSEFRFSKDIGAKESKVRTSDQTVIAKFWLDGTGTITPPGHWNQIAADLAVQRGNTLQQNARLFALLNIALADASIIDADQKYTFNRWRPVTAIQQADKDNNARTIPDPNWTPLLSTPSSPAYVSGHSTFSGAADVVLTNFFGKNTKFTTNADPSLNLPPRSFKNFAEAAEEAGMSRVYSGVHWQSDNRDGLIAGRKLGKYVVKNFLLPK
jgi:membrane-associated phospholipid phosphatase